MTQEPETLYKLMILYMLNAVNFPLTNSQLSDFFLKKDYTGYFTLQQVLNDLTDSGLISSRPAGNATHYDITDEGRETLGYFEDNISNAAVLDMDDYLRENKFRLRSEVSVIADFNKLSNRNYLVHCEVREGRDVLISLDLSVPDEKDAALMCANWRERCQEFYSGTIRMLMTKQK